MNGTTSTELRAIDRSAAEEASPQSQKVFVTCIDYSPDHVQIQEITDLTAFLAQHRPEWSAVRWIDIDGLSDMEVIRAFAEKYQLHPLAVEDVVHIPQRP